MTISHPPCSVFSLAADSAARHRRGAPSRLSRPLLRRALAPTRRRRAPPPPVASRWSPHPSPRTPPRPEPPRRPPPRCRRGEPKPEAQLSIFRAPEHYKNPRIRFHSLLCSLLAPTLQNTAAAPLEPRRASPRRGAATPDPLHPYSPHHQSRLVLAQLPGHFPSPKPHRSYPPPCSEPASRRSPSTSHLRPP